MEIEASAANRLIMKLGSDESWDLDDVVDGGYIFYHKWLSTYWKLSCEGVWTDWLAEQVSLCPSCDQMMLVHFPLKPVRKVPFTTFRWEHAKS